MSSKPLKIGVMGCGFVADYGHFPAMARVPRYDLHAVFDPRFESAVAAQKKHGAAHAFHEVDAFFGSGLDAVVITSAAPAHEANVLSCAEHGVPALCEKPLAMDEEQADRMIQAMNAAGQPLYVAFCYRYGLNALRIKELLGQGAIGEVKAMRLIYNWDNHGKYENRDATAAVIEQRRHGRMLEGGPMVDCGVHQIDLARWWMGSEVTAFAGHGAWVDDYEAPDHIWAHLDHDNGCHTMVEMSYSFGHTMQQPEPMFVYQLIGTEGVILYHREKSRFELRNIHGTFPQEYHEEKNFTGVHQRFAHFLRTGEPGDLCTAEQGQEATRIARTITDNLIAERASTSSGTSVLA
jgi:predicted dehydrogenase